MSRDAFAAKGLVQQPDYFWLPYRPDAGSDGHFWQMGVWVWKLERVLWKPWILVCMVLSFAKSQENVGSQVVPMARYLPLVSQWVGFYLDGPQEQKKVLLLRKLHHPL